MENFCEICREIMSHNMKDYTYNLKNPKDKWCAICEGNSYDIVNYVFNMNNNPNCHRVSQTTTVDQNQPMKSNCWNDTYNHWRGCNGRR